jgi:hypothetical protein
VSKSDLDEFIGGDEALLICADIANGSKHLNLRPRTGDANTGIKRIDVDVDLQRGVVRHRFSILSGGEYRDALALAEEIVQKWRAFLQTRRLMP